jgi:low affinity Fe/Cu permease
MEADVTAAVTAKRRGTRPDRTFGERFNRVADWLTVALGSLPALAGSVLLVVVWALTGPLFGFSDTWQLFINTTTTVVTFWMVFVIQNSANRSAKATQLKLDELIRAVQDARNEFIALDQAPEKVLVEREQELMKLSRSEAADGGSNARASNPKSGPSRKRRAART